MFTTIKTLNHLLKAPLDYFLKNKIEIKNQKSEIKNHLEHNVQTDFPNYPNDSRTLSIACSISKLNIQCCSTDWLFS